MGRISHVTRAKCPKADDGDAREATSCGCKGFWTGVGCNMINCSYKLDMWSTFYDNVTMNNDTRMQEGFWDGMTLNQFEGGSLCGCRGDHCSTTICKHRRFYGQTYCHATSEDNHVIGQDERSMVTPIVPCSPVNGSYFSYSQLRRLPTCKCRRGERRADGTCRCPDGFRGALCELESGNQNKKVGILFNMNGSKLYGYNFNLSPTTSSGTRLSSSDNRRSIFDYYSIMHNYGSSYSRTSSINNSGNSLTIFLFVIMLILSLLMCLQRRRSTTMPTTAHHRCSVLTAAGAPARYDPWGQLFFMRGLSGWRGSFRTSWSGHPDVVASSNNRRRESSSCYVYERGAHTWRLIRVSPDRTEPLVARNGRSRSVEGDAPRDVSNEQRRTRVDLPTYDEATQAPPPYGQIL